MTNSSFVIMDAIPRYNVVHKLEKRKLLIAVNAVAALSIFFFGYDQGMMGGVNNAPDYYENTMKFGYMGSDGAPVITRTILQGGIVSSLLQDSKVRPNPRRSLFIILAPWSVVCLEAGSLINTDGSKRLLLGPSGVLLVQLFRRLRRTRIG